MNSKDPGFPLMDAERFLECMSGDASLCVDILETGLKEWGEQVAEIRNLTADSDEESARRALHSLRGGSSTFEASSLAGLLQKMESECEVSGVKSMLPQLAAFETEAIAYREGLLCLIDELRGRI